MPDRCDSNVEDGVWEVLALPILIEFRPIPSRFPELEAGAAVAAEAVGAASTEGPPRARLWPWAGLAAAATPIGVSVAGCSGPGGAHP